jgi:hypothetical protein
MRHFKLPLIVTAITVAVALVVGIAIATKIYLEKISDRQKKARAEMLGQGIGMGVLVIIFPFWILAAGKVGKERRAAREAEQQVKADADGTANN